MSQPTDTTQAATKPKRVRRAAPDVSDAQHPQLVAAVDARTIRRLSMKTPSFAQKKEKLKWTTYDPMVHTPAAPQRAGSFDAFTKPSIFGSEVRMPKHHAQPQRILVAVGRGRKT